MEQECSSMTFCSNLSANEKVGSGYVNDPGFLQKSSRTFLLLAISHFLGDVNANMQLIPLTLNNAGWNCTGPLIMWICFNKYSYSQPSISAGFQLTNSTNCRSKTIFSIHSWATVDADGHLIHKFSTAWGVSAPIVQGSIAPHCSKVNC